MVRVTEEIVEPENLYADNGATIERPKGYRLVEVKILQKSHWDRSLQCELPYEVLCFWEPIIEDNEEDEKT